MAANTTATSSNVDKRLVPSTAVSSGLVLEEEEAASAAAAVEGVEAAAASAAAVVVGDETGASGKRGADLAVETVTVDVPPLDLTLDDEDDFFKDFQPVTSKPVLESYRGTTHR